MDQASTIAVVAPRWLQDALEVLLDGTSDMQLVASATDIDSLILLDLDRTPEFVLLDAGLGDREAVEQVHQIVATWPGTDCIVLVDRSIQMTAVKEAGASLALLKGSSPQRLKEVLKALSEAKLRDHARAPRSRL